MNAVLENKEKNTVEFKFEISAKDFNKGINKAYLASRQYFTVPGFRKGKAPRQIIEMSYGKEIFHEEAINEILPEAYEKAIEELGIDPVEQPEIDIDEIVRGEAIEVRVTVDVKPEVELGEYKGIEIEKIEYEVTDELVEEELKKVQDMNARLVDAGDRPVKDGDLLTIDYEGYVGDDQFDGGTAQHQQLEIGSEQFIPGFEEQLVGKSIDEEIEIEVTFPEDYHDDALSGKDAKFKVTIHDIKEKEFPELDDEFAKDVSEFDTLDEYKEDLREKLVESNKEREKVEQENLIVETVVKNAKVDIPEGMIRTQINNDIQELNQQLGQQGLGLEQYLGLTGMSKEELEEQIRPMAEDTVKGDLVLEAIGKAEEITVDEEDRVEEIKKMAEIYSHENPEEFVEEMQKGDLSFLDQALTNQKVIEFLKENVTLK